MDRAGRRQMDRLRLLAARRQTQGVIDHFNDAAVTAAGRYVDDNQFTDAASRLLRVHGGSFFEDSLEINAEGLYWNDELAGQFSRRRGYDVRRFLPLFYQQGMNRVLGAGDAAARPTSTCPTRRASGSATTTTRR